MAMKKFEHFFRNPDDVDKIASLRQMRERLLKSLLSSAVGIGAVLYIIALVPVFTNKIPILYPIVYTIVFVWLLAITYIKPLSLYAVRAFSLLSFLYILGASNLFLGGLRAGASLFFLTFIALFTLLAGIRGGIISLASISITLTIIGILTSLGYITPSWSYSGSDPVPWLISSLTMILMGVLLMISISTLIRSLDEQLRKAILFANDLSQAYEATIEGWSHALDLRDKETEGHSQRVTDLTLHLAQTLGMGEAELLQVRRGALLHDIGKMGIPDQILLKPGALIDEEWVIMRKHPESAYKLLAPIAYLKPALDIPYCHHEKWDGTGYPRGLKGEEIPLAARLFAVVDVWDALRSERPYRAAWTEEKVREHIQSLAGTHFDPHVVQVFLESDISTSREHK